MRGDNPGESRVEGTGGWRGLVKTAIPKIHFIKKEVVGEELQ